MDEEIRKITVTDGVTFMGAKSYLCRIPVIKNRDYFNIPIQKKDTDLDTYQRALTLSRLKDIYIKFCDAALKGDEYNFPLPVTLFVRDPHSYEHIEFVEKNSKIWNYDPSIAGNLYFCDGQHRYKGILKTYDDLCEILKQIEEGEVEGVNLPQDMDLNKAMALKAYLEKIEMSATVFFGDRDVEKAAFHEINAHQKPMDTNLVENQLCNAKKTGNSYAYLFGRAKKKEDSNNTQIAGLIIKEENQDPKSVWYQRINLGGSVDKESLQRPNAGIKQMQKSFRENIIKSDVIKMLLIKRKDKKGACKDAFCAFWYGLKMAKPKWFDDRQKQKFYAKDYSVQKIIGADVLMKMFPTMSQVISNQKGNDVNSIFDPKEWEKIFKKMFTNFNIDGLTADEFFRTKGGLKKYSSEGGKATLVEMLNEYI